MKNNNAFARFAVGGLLLVISASGHAQSGTIDIVLSATANEYAVEMGDTTVTASGGNGTLTILHSSGRPFVEGASATVKFAGFSKNTPSGLELEADGLATFSPEDTLLLIFERRSYDPGAAGEGKLHLTGGDGRLAGIDGQCNYRAENLPGGWNVTAKCQWLYSFPYR
jgi:hypothetical protein